MLFKTNTKLASHEYLKNTVNFYHTCLQHYSTFTIYETIPFGILPQTYCIPSKTVQNKSQLVIGLFLEM